MALVKATFNTALSSQLSSILEPVFEELFLDGLAALPDNVRAQSQAKAREKAAAWSSKLAPQFAAAISDQVDVYIKTATVTVASGISVATAGTAAAQTGTTTTPGTGVIS